MQQPPRPLPRTILTAGLLPDPDRCAISEFLEQPVEPQPAALVTDNAVQLGTYQLRYRLFELPRPLRRQDDTGPVKKARDRRVKPFRALRWRHQRIQRGGSPLPRTGRHSKGAVLY